VKLRLSTSETIFTIIEKLKRDLQEAKSEEGNESDREVKDLGKLPFWIVRWLTKIFRWLDNHNLAPKGMIDKDPLYTSTYIANVGTIHLPAPFHHLFQWGNCSVFLGIGEYTKRAVVDKDNNIVVRDIMDIIVTWDDRISEGIYGAKAMQLLKGFIENPEQLENPIEIDEKLLKEHMLKEY
jgi:hypothetical protein